MKPGESFIGQPIRGLQTMLRVLAEDNHQLPTVVPDGIYGPTTANAVSAFQRSAGLPVTGVTNQETWEEIVKNYEPALIRIGKAEPIKIVLDPGQVFRSGDSSPYIYLLQSMLTQLASDAPTIIAPNHTGVMDNATKSAVNSFQGLAGLPITGEVDKVTWKHLAHHFSLSAVAKRHNTP